MAKVELLIEKQNDGYSCKHCEYTTKGKRHMIEHVEKHIEGLEYSCNSCNRIFGTSHNLRDHISRYARCTPKTSKLLAKWTRTQHMREADGMWYYKYITPNGGRIFYSREKAGTHALALLSQPTP